MTDSMLLSEARAVSPLHGLHVARGGKMTTFAGYETPLHYGDGIAAEHQHTRLAASLFDISYLGQAFLVGPDHETAARALEAVVPGDILRLAPGGQRYTQVLNDEGGILDDVVVTRSADPTEDGALMVVANAPRKAAVFALLTSRLSANVKLLPAPHRAFIALQGPKSADVLARHAAEIRTMPFMTAQSARFDGIECHISRSGYTGEDGFEISAKSQRMGAIAERLLDDPAVKLAGLGARDSLRLEAGFCLYGRDIDETTSPVEAGLAWSIPQRRRDEGGFPGAARVQGELRDGPARLRVGLTVDGAAPVEANSDLRAADGETIGKVTSSTYGATVGAPVAMGYVPPGHAAAGQTLTLGSDPGARRATIAALPFVPHRHYRG